MKKNISSKIIIIISCALFLSSCSSNKNIEGNNVSETLETTTVLKEETTKYDVMGKLDNTKKEAESLKKALEAASTQLDMNDLSYQRSLLWNDMLDYIWLALEETVDDTMMKELQEEQQEWFEHKENEIEKAMAEFAGGSIASMVGSEVDSELTEKRVYELLENFFE